MASSKEGITFEEKLLIDKFTNELFEEGHRISYPMIKKCTDIAIGYAKQEAESFYMFSKKVEAEHKPKGAHFFIVSFEIAWEEYQQFKLRQPQNNLSA